MEQKWRGGGGGGGSSNIELSRFEEWLNNHPNIYLKSALVLSLLLLLSFYANNAFNCNLCITSIKQYSNVCDTNILLHTFICDALTLFFRSFFFFLILFSCSFFFFFAPCFLVSARLFDLIATHIQNIVLPRLEMAAYASCSLTFLMVQCAHCYAPVCCHASKGCTCPREVASIKHPPLLRLTVLLFTSCAINRMNYIIKIFSVAYV